MNNNIGKLISITLFSCVNLAAMNISNHISNDAQNTKPTKIIYRASTVSEEFENVISLARQAPFFKANGYTIAFPQHPDFIALVQNPNTLKNADIPSLQQIFNEHIYSSLDYDQEVVSTAQTSCFVEKAISKLALLKNSWQFKLMDEYQVLVTLYGPGGRYQPEQGLVVTIPQTKLTKNIAHSIVHEIVHIGIEKNIVQQYHLTHWEKERLVDLICLFYLHDLMPDYQVQINGDTHIDPFISTETIILDLPAAIEKFVASYPRQIKGKV